MKFLIAGSSLHHWHMISASALTQGGETQFQLERAVTSLTRLGVCLARILLAIKPGSIFHVCKQVPYELLKFLSGSSDRYNAANIHSGEVIFTLPEEVGAGASSEQGKDSSSGQGGTSDEGGMRERAGSGGRIHLGRLSSSTVGGGYTIVHTHQIVILDRVAKLNIQS